MADWQRVLDIKAEWAQAKDGAITYKELAKVIVARLKVLTPLNISAVASNQGELNYAEMKRHDLIEEFEAYAEDEDDPDEGSGWFNSLMTELYDWGDMRLDSKFGGKKVCWIKTEF